MAAPALLTLDTRVDLNLRAAMACFGNSGVTSLPGVQTAYSGTRANVFNSAMLTSRLRSTGDWAERLAAARRHFAILRVPWSFWLSSAMVPAHIAEDVRHILQREGFRLSSEAPGMVAESLLPPRRRLPALEIVPVDSAATRCGFCHVMAAAFRSSYAMLSEVYVKPGLWDSGFVGYVGSLDGRAVATAAVVSGGESLGIYAVATLPDEQRKGYAEAMVRHAVARAAHPLVLQATPMGLPLYERMGFRRVTGVAVYTLG